MTDDKELTPPVPAVTGPKSTKEEVALDLMRFIASTTGLGKSGGGAGFSGKAPKSVEDQVDTLIQLYERCRKVVDQ